MFQFLEAFLLSVLAGLATYAITGERGWSGRKRLGVVVGIVPLVALAAALVDRLHSNASPKEGSPSAEAPVAKPTGAKPEDKIRQLPLPKTATSPEDAFMKKYVAEDGPPYRTGGWTVMISAAGPNSFPELHAAAESALSEKGYAVRPLFRSTLLQDSAAYDELYAGNPALLQRISSYRDGVLIGKLRSEVSQNTSLDMFTAHLFIDLRAISAHSARIEGQFTIDETGAGFSEAAATTAAEHRMADKLKQRLLQAIPPK